MLGEKKTLPLWRRRHPNFLSLERALAQPARQGRDTARATTTEHVVIDRHAARRRFEEGKGKIHPPA